MFYVATLYHYVISSLFMAGTSHWLSELMMVASNNRLSIPVSNEERRLNFSTHASSRLTFQLFLPILISHFSKIQVKPVKLCFRVFRERCRCNFYAATHLMKLEKCFRLTEHCDIYLQKRQLLKANLIPMRTCSKPALGNFGVSFSNTLVYF